MPITTARFSPGEARAPATSSPSQQKETRTKARSRFQFGRARATNYGASTVKHHGPIDQTVVTFQTASEGDPVRVGSANRELSLPGNDRQSHGR